MFSVKEAHDVLSGDLIIPAILCLRNTIKEHAFDPSSSYHTEATERKFASE